MNSHGGQEVLSSELSEPLHYDKLTSLLCVSAG
jgi:hypothetical protein